MNEFLINLKDEIDRRIIFAVVAPDQCNPPGQPTKHKDGITYYPSELELRRFRFGRNDVIWLQELPDKNCKECYGQGKLGIITRKSEVPEKDIAMKIHAFISDEPQMLPGEIIKLMKLPDDMKEPLDILINIAAEELTDSPAENWKVADKYAKIIKQDFLIKEWNWCKCFIKNYLKAVEDTRRRIKFGIN